MSLLVVVVVAVVLLGLVLVAHSGCEPVCCSCLLLLSIQPAFETRQKKLNTHPPTNQTKQNKQLIRSLTPFGDGPCAAVSFDHSGLYLSCGGKDGARVYGSKQDWAEVKALGDAPKKGVSALKAGPDMRTLLVGGAGDHNLRVFGVAQ